MGRHRDSKEAGLSVNITFPGTEVKPRGCFEEAGISTISGYLMMVHATFAPVFAVCLAVLAVMWARRCRLDQSDCPPLQYILQRVTRLKTAGELLCKSSRLGQKVTFWLIIFLALPLILSIILSMFPLFGTHWQELLLSMHRYTALVFVLVVIVHIYLIIRTKMLE
ncbi:MAG: cytochrome b/b6 domain-containing protein [Planctomycetota bacterium]|jgi:cytochrome b subunit of formate dehydrogenase